MKTFLFVSIVLTLCAAWAADHIQKLFMSNPVSVLVGALVLLALVVCYVLLRPHDSETHVDERDPRAWMNADTARALDVRGATRSERLHTDSRGVTWWETTNPDGRVTLEHENYDDIMQATENRLRKL